MKGTIAICGHSLTNGGLQKVAGLASLALAELGFDIVHLLEKTDPVAFDHAGSILPANINLPEVRQAVAGARLVFDYGYRDEGVTPFLRYLAEHAAGKVMPTAHNTLTVGNYLDVYRDLKILQRAPAVLCVSQAVRAAAEQRYGPLPNARVMYCAIDPRFSPGPAPAKDPLHPRPYFIFVGRPSIHHKGLDHLLAAWSQSGLASSHDLLLLGADPPPDKLSTLIAASGVGASIHCLPFTDNVAPWIAQAMALVLASRHEGLGLVLPEALHCGTPCIATRCGGPEEVIQDGVNGFLLDVGDTAGFAAAMNRIAGEPGLRARLAAAAPASVERFLYPAHVRAWEGLLTDLGVYQSSPSATPLARVAPSVPLSNISAPPAVSVQLPVYNKARYLRECLDSITAQTFTDFEVICVDDASTDGSWDILREYAARDPRFRLFRHETNLGTLAARKRCFIEARGDYMAFIDADDLADPNMLAHLHSLTEGRIDLVQCAAQIHDPEKILSDKLCEQYERHYGKVAPVQLNGADVWNNLLRSIKTNLWLSLASRKVYQAILPHIPAERLQHGNDNLLVLMLAFFSKSFRSTDQVLYRFRANHTSSNFISIAPDKALAHIESRARVMQCAKNFLKQVTPDSDWSQPPYAKYFDALAGYPAQLITRCVEYHPESLDSLVAAYQHSFGDWSKNHISQILANAATKQPSALPAPPKQTFLKLLRAVAKYWRVARHIRHSGLFFPSWYLARNPDVRAAGWYPLMHYLAYGALEGRDPNPLFDTAWYLRANPDAASCGNPLLHYILYGWRENRSPSPRFNVADYLRAYPKVAENGVEPLKHYFLRGIVEGVRLPASKPPDQKSSEPKAPDTQAGATPPAAPPASEDPIPPSFGGSASEPKMSAPAPDSTIKPFMPVLKLSTVLELDNWYSLYPEFVTLREKMQGISEKDYRNTNLKLIQDLALVDFMSRNLRPGAKILEIGGGYSRVLTYFKDRFEGWNLDKFEGIGNGPKRIPTGMPYKIVPDYIGAFSKDLPDGYFDFVFSNSVFEHIRGDAAAMNAITDDIDRLLKPDGLQVHCMDCRFSPARPLDLPKQRPLINHVIERDGFKAQYIYDHYRDPEVFTMSGQAYDRFWKKACNDRPHELDGLPFNIFLAAGRSPRPSASAPMAKMEERRPTSPGSESTAPSNAVKTASAGATIRPVDHIPPSSRLLNLEQKIARPTPNSPNASTMDPFVPVMKLSTMRELADWHRLYPDFVALYENKTKVSVEDYRNSNLKLIQDLAIVDFISNNLHPGAKILEIGGGYSRVLVYFKDRFEGWNLDKFEGIGNGPKKIPTDMPYKIVPDYIGAFSKDLPNGYFDLIFSISVFEHVEGDAAAMSAITDDIDRLLKPDGLQVHCMDCRFPPPEPIDLPKQRPLINHVIERNGFKAQYIYDHYRDPEVFTMSAQAYDRFWKKTLNGRPHELHGLPCNIFLAAGRSSQLYATSPPGESRPTSPGSESTYDLQATETSTINERPCNICGSTSFKAAWRGRLNNGVPPRCAQCLSCERHRVIRRAFDDMPPTWFNDAGLLQFSDDPSVPAERFGKTETSIFNGKNHLDLQAIDRPDASYDWVICNHVLEHVADDRKAIREMLRIVKPKGVLLFSYPQPISREKTTDWGYPDEKLDYHYRTYGRDAIATRFADAFTGWYILSYQNDDPVTNTTDICYFATRDPLKFSELRDRQNWEVIISQDSNPQDLQCNANVKETTKCKLWGPSKEVIYLPSTTADLRAQNVYYDGKINDREYTLHPGDPVIVVLTYGKVASSAVTASLNSHYKRKTPVYQIHVFDDEIPNNPTTPIVNHLLAGQALYKIYKQYKNILNWKFITGIREPVALGISGYFQNIFLKCGYNRDELLKTIIFNRNRDNFLDRYFNKNTIGFDWIDTHFNSQNGYAIASKDNISLLIYRYDKLENIFTTAMHKLLGVPNIALQKTNESSKKLTKYNGVTIADGYAKATKEFTIPIDICKKLYNHKSITHFYTPYEINEFIMRWTKSPK